MPLTQGADRITPTQGSTSRVLIAEQADYATAARNLGTGPAIYSGTGSNTGNGDFYRYQPRINAADLAREGTTLESPELDGTAAQSKDAPGPFDIANGMTLGFSGNGTALPLAMLTQDLAPAWNIYGGSGQTIPAAVTVVASTAVRTASTDLTVADDLTSTTNPVKLNFDFSSSVEVASGVARAIISIEGTDHNDDFIEEELTFGAGLNVADTTTRLWYKTVTKITVVGFDEDAADTVTVTARDMSAQVIFRPQDERLVRFWTALIAKGLVPNTFTGLCMQSAVIEITREALVGFTCTFLGQQGYLYENLRGNRVIPEGARSRPGHTDGPITGPNPVADARAETITGIAGLEKASPDVFGGWQGKLTGENTDIHVAAQNVTLTINQNLTYTDVLGFQYQVTQPARDVKRLVQIEAEVVYAPENNFSTYFEGNRILPNMRIELSQDGEGVYPYETTLVIPEFQLTSTADPSVDSQGVVTQNIIGKAVLPPGQDWEYEWQTRYSQYDQVRHFN